MRWLTRGHGLSAVTVGALLMTSSASAQVVIGGRVVEKGTGAGIAGAQVEVVDTLGRPLAVTVTDPEGSFRAEIEKRVPVRVRVERYGYAAAEGPVLGLGDRLVELRVELPIQPTVLDSINVEIEPAKEWGRDGFEKRRALGKGVFLDRRFILRTGADWVAEIFRNIEGMQVRWLRHLPTVVSNRGCMVTLVNRLPSRGAIDRTVRPETIIGIELYRDFREVPPEFQLMAWRGASPCGVILYWTRAAWAPREGS